MAQLVLLPGKDRSLARRHPWIFAAAVDRLGGRARAGDTVEVVAANGRPLAKAAWSPESKIRARVWTFDPRRDRRRRFLQAPYSGRRRTSSG
jgi:23S rRNA (cytosine1962-C5)-methyltransferase